jgi:FtsZ-binding cell division protein ZapB
MVESKKFFSQLEVQLTQVIQVLNSLKTENKELMGKNEKLKKDLEEVTGKNYLKDQKIKQLKGDRLEVQARVEKIMQKMTVLE